MRSDTNNSRRVLQNPENKVRIFIEVQAFLGDPGKDIFHPYGEKKENPGQIPAGVA